MKQWALVTGASSGIGLHFAEQLAKGGVSLIISARSAAKLDELAAQWRSQYGVQVETAPGDLSRQGAAEALVATVRGKGIALNYLINNAGVGVFGEFKDNDLDGELAMMRLNMDSLTILTKRFLPDLIANRGKILNVASTASFQPGPYMAVYYATKAYVLSFSEALAEELAPHGVSVTALCPGPTASGFQDKADMHHSAMVKGKRLPTSEQVAIEGYQAMMGGKRVFIQGFMNWLMAQSVRFTPRRVVTALVAFLTRPTKV
ncbi:SDR family oxidoreductase [Limnobacter humi]|uniref:SDR family oxidoreductase n=1 Tax=Limnobacter humi TaxID=1778671 RepID=A0ABT1WJV8_9BURK|nr:SDR family oxidoreductase [Limnobacter humi]MCQ8897022.1 SDR family oxidoreductase [Limnobacter humi]